MSADSQFKDDISVAIMRRLLFSAIAVHCLTLAAILHGWTTCSSVSAFGVKTTIRSQSIRLFSSSRPPLRSIIRSRVSNVLSRFKNTDVEEEEEEGLSEFEFAKIKRENALLRDIIRQMEQEEPSKKTGPLVLESFEGEGKNKLEPLWYRDDSSKGLATLRTSDESVVGGMSEMAETELWCDELADGDTCPVEPTVSFFDALKDRSYWLVGLLALQSCSGFILSHNEALLENHPVIIYFLTMLVGAGGNAGNQASVRVIRGLALGTLNEQTQSQFLFREFKMAMALCCILSVAGFARATVFATPLPETIAVTSALALIVFSSICMGAVLPLLLKKIGVDPAHSSTTIQVIMDIFGVVMTVVVSGAILDSQVGQMLISKLTG